MRKVAYWASFVPVTMLIAAFLVGVVHADNVYTQPIGGVTLPATMASSYATSTVTSPTFQVQGTVHMDGGGAITTISYPNDGTRYACYLVQEDGGPTTLVGPSASVFGTGALQTLTWTYTGAPDITAGHTYSIRCIITSVIGSASSTYDGSGTGAMKIVVYDSSGAQPVIDFGALYTPVVYNPSVAAIATSSGLWSDLSLASSTQSCTSGNFFTDGVCAAGTFLFVPNPDILNGYASLASTTLPSKFPFSWWYSLKATYASLSASSTANMATVTIDFSSVDPATSTLFAHILPNATILSSTTITRYMPAGFLTLMLTLEAAALWVIFGTYLWFDIPRRWLHK